MFLVFSLLLLQAPDEAPDLIRHLESESIAIREEATRRLLALGEPALARLEKAREETRDAEVKARIDSIVAGIRRAAELAKAFGPTKRVTIAARGQPLKEILARLATPGIAFDTGPLDEESRIDFQIRNGTWWEAMDRFAATVNARYDIEEQEGGRIKLTLSKGRVKSFPTLYLEQFRLSVAETRRIEVRTPGVVKENAILVVEVVHQAGLQPFIRGTHGPLRISATDSGGNNARVVLGESPEDDWEGCPLGYRQEVRVRADAAFPLTLAGATNLTFPAATKEIALDLAGEKSKVRLGSFGLHVAEFTPSTTSTILRLRAMGGTDADREDRIPTSTIVLTDARGRRQEGSMRVWRNTEEFSEWEVEFTSGIQEPRQVKFTWITEFHQVEVPFRFEGVRLPEAR